MQDAVGGVPERQRQLRSYEPFEEGQEQSCQCTFPGAGLSHQKQHELGFAACQLQKMIQRCQKGMEVYLIKDFSEAKHNTKDNNRKLDSSGMDIPDYAYERMAKCLLLESEDGKTTLLNSEEDGENRYAA